MIVTGRPPAVGPARGCMEETVGGLPHEPLRGGDDEPLGGSIWFACRRCVAPGTFGPRSVATATFNCGGGKVSCT